MLGRWALELCNANYFELKNVNLMEKKSTRGGARPGAGRKPIGKPLTTVSIRLLEEEKERLKKFTKFHNITIRKFIIKALDDYELNHFRF